MEESIAPVIQKINAVLSDINEFMVQVRDKERLITKLSAKVQNIEAKRLEAEELAKKEKEASRAEMIKQGEEIIASAEKRAKEKADMLVSSAKAELAKAQMEKESLANQIVSLRNTFAERSASVSAEINKLELQKSDLESEIKTLIRTRDGLREEIELFRNKMISLMDRP